MVPVIPCLLALLDLKVAGMFLSKNIAPMCGLVPLALPLAYLQETGMDYAVTCNSAGTAYAAGAPWGSGTRGYAQVMAYFGSWMTTRRGKYTAFKQSQQAAARQWKVKSTKNCWNRFWRKTRLVCGYDVQVCPFYKSWKIQLKISY